MRTAMQLVRTFVWGQRDRFSSEKDGGAGDPSGIRGKRCSCITRTDAVKIRIAGTQCDRKFIPVCFRMVGPFLTFKSNFLNGRSNRKQGERES